MNISIVSWFLGMSLLVSLTIAHQCMKSFPAREDSNVTNTYQEWLNKALMMGMKVKLLEMKRAKVEISEVLAVHGKTVTWVVVKYLTLEVAFWETKWLLLQLDTFVVKSTGTVGGMDISGCLRKIRERKDDPRVWKPFSKTTARKTIEFPWLTSKYCFFFNISEL